MWAMWIAMILGGIGVLLLLMAVAFGPAAPVYAVVIGVALIVAIVVGLSARRSAQVGSEHQVAAKERREASTEPRPEPTEGARAEDAGGPPAAPTSARGARS
jgi:hypothetical protein